jgi:hypothetical protein
MRCICHRAHGVGRPDPVDPNCPEHGDGANLPTRQRRPLPRLGRVLPCGCPARIVADEGHQEGCGERDRVPTSTRPKHIGRQSPDWLAQMRGEG